uniref:Chromo domain-containing protein n=1 Tax=Branchiostoma floridae TaxID=7739 RepID=C3XSF8_BRAFL|eukprot:XP_002612870.1 hypothetical protein BRAFLDRAFT_129977 [Branchiostoma floridae]
MTSFGNGPIPVITKLHTLTSQDTPLHLNTLQIIEADVTRDEKNRKVPEYLIHFKGWNSSWDRWATEDHVVKDSEENRVLQKQLAKEALAKITAESEEEPTEIPVDIPVVLKDRLEEDHIMICKRGKLVQLPCQPNVITILENYLRFFAAKGTSVSDRLHHQLSRAAQPFAAKFPTPSNVHSTRVPPPERNVDLVKEVVDGVRIMFDFILPLTLLYQDEEVQHTQMATSTFIPLTPPVGQTEADQAATPPPPKIRVTRSASRSPICHEAQKSHEPYPLRDSAVKFSPRKRRHSSISHAQPLPAAVRQAESQTPSPPPLIPAPPPPPGEPATAMDVSDKLSSVDTAAAEVKVQHKALLDEAMCKLLPDDFSQDGQNSPSLIYGAQHLLRLFVKLPELLGKMHLPEVKSKILCYHLQLFLKYLADHRDDLLPATAYVSAAEVLGNLRQPKVIR